VDVAKMLDDLRARRDQIEDVMLALTRLNTGERRGRPPKWLAEAKKQDPAQEVPKKPKRFISPEARQRMAEAQRKRWAAERKSQGA
jgi:hypothetical protein